MAEGPDGSVEPRPRERGSAWLRVLLIGGTLYFLGVGILVLTQNPNLFPTVIMLGGFLVPAAFVAFFYERRYLSRLSISTTALAFFYGGVLGVFAASLLEPIFIRQLDFFSAFLVGLIEEAAKILGVLVIARHRRHDAEMDGLILGAAAGMGFAALESTGYAFTGFVESGGSLSTMVAIILVRGLLAPLGHGTWTAILAAVLFREGHVGHFHLDRKVIGTYLLVSGLHGLWDGVPSLFTTILGRGVDLFVGQFIVGGVGIYLLVVLWRDARRRQLQELQAQATAAQRPAEAVVEQEAAAEAGEPEPLPAPEEESPPEQVPEEMRHGR